ncbi:8-amino-7-oxononanoate synthase [Gulbenkiania mobilis]|uniref:8-amino-7-oxononanoate synthase n=1 Tax=Gulbenkiania mobilis TaxID=397457 RepID=UPI0006BBD179|nr:8-amino-7-oxononanoate synthase [Gulbenkiania mobilis]
MTPSELGSRLAALEQAGRLRRRPLLDGPQQPACQLDGAPTLAFASNDYLGLAAHPRLAAAIEAGLARYGSGAGASHLVAGHSRAHAEAEAAFADYAGHEAALLFGSGYSANLAVITSLAGRGDAVFGDRLNHASLNDAARLSRATFRRFRHNDPDHLEYLLKNTPAASRLIAVDAIYSMDGDEAPLEALLALAERHDAWLYVDDAHGFGIRGGGRGSLAGAGLESPRLIHLATLGKAAGLYGACVGGSRLLVDWLVNTARTYIYTTAQPPALAHAVPESLALIADADDRRQQLAGHIHHLQQRLHSLGMQLIPSRSPIQALIIGANTQALACAERLRAQGIRVPAIRPPTVPEGTARLRISLSAAHRPEDIERLAEALHQSLL